MRWIGYGDFLIWRCIMYKFFIVVLIFLKEVVFILKYFNLLFLFFILVRKFFMFNLDEFFINKVKWLFFNCRVVIWFIFVFVNLVSFKMFLVFWIFIVINFFFFLIYVLGYFSMFLVILYLILMNFIKNWLLLIGG